VLVVNPENTTRVVDYADRSAAVLWGDATSAAIVSAEVPARLKISATMLDSSPAGWGQVTVPRFGHFAQNGSAVQRFAIKTTLVCLEKLLPAARERVAKTGGQVKFIGHQANGLMLDSVIRRAEIAPENHFHNVLDFGNTGAAGAPSVLSGAWDKLVDGDTVVLVVNPENTTRVVDYADRSAAVLWGDATSAAIVAATRKRNCWACRRETWSTILRPSSSSCPRRRC
ncbi:MAG: 3-oxoacyl-[acyl-carrier-protein] synthase, partial [Myxococcaceae bacterium]|nr:3-oxoacyl-[acyl-carrier-protein] synthase [Myxococcaceae bacterium]